MAAASAKPSLFLPDDRELSLAALPSDVLDLVWSASFRFLCDLSLSVSTRTLALELMSSDLNRPLTGTKIK